MIKNGFIMKKNGNSTMVEYHQDIRFLMRRMDILLSLEEYERMVVLKRWIDELIEYYHGNEFKK